MNKSLFTNFFIPLVQLTKPVITLSVAFSALMGYLLATGSFQEGWISLYLGVLLIAAGSSAINQIQESRHDKLMERTRSRPIPAGNISKKKAWVWAILLALSGGLILWVLASPLSSILAIITLVWYNLVYTPLKRVTAYAVIPGALVGALPPVIGWSAASASITDPVIILVAFFFFMGQIPHFWLILLKHGKDYQKAGFPSITALYSPKQLTRITMIWVVAMVIAAIILPLSGVLHYTVFKALVFLYSVVILFSFRNWIKGSQAVNVQRAFISLNIYYLMMMLTLIGDSLSR